MAHTIEQNYDTTRGTLLNHIVYSKGTPSACDNNPIWPRTLESLDPHPTLSYVCQNRWPCFINITTISAKNCDVAPYPKTEIWLDGDTNLYYGSGL
jgi:hypothetical protein